MINVLIVHYNTPELTEACVKSINKHTPGCKIFIFDNSDKRPFTACFDNVEIIDNTKGQIIDFEKELALYPNKRLRPKIINNYGSAKHAMSIQKFLDLNDFPIVLMDSDILLKKDISEIVNLDYTAIGEIADDENRKINRLLPFLCFINTPKLQCKYFDSQRCCGIGYKNNLFWDTGASFLQDLIDNKANIKNIFLQNYCIHFRAGSWYNMSSVGTKKIQCSPKEWLENNKKLWN